MPNVIKGYDHSPEYSHAVIHSSVRFTSAFVINMISVMERMDEQILPAVSKFVGCYFPATLWQLGNMTLYKGLAQALASPFGGVAGHNFDRVWLLAIGAAIWGSCTLSFAFVPPGYVHLATLCWAINGVGLSLLIPNSQSLIADYYPSSERGAAFGALGITGGFGAMLGALFATSIGGQRIIFLGHQFQGWQVAFITVALVSWAIGLLTLTFARDPRSLPHVTEHLEDCYSAPNFPNRRRMRRSRGLTLGQAATKQRHFTRSGSYSALATLEDEDEEQSNHWSSPPRQIKRRASCDILFYEHGKSRHKGGRNSADPGNKAPYPYSWPDTGRRPEDDVYSPLQRQSSMLQTWPSGPADVAEHGQGATPLLVQRAPLTLKRLWRMLCVPSFMIIIFQGIIGSCPWTALVFLTFYLQLLGMTDTQASLLMALLIGATAAGGLLGGWLGDKAAQHWPDAGRIALVQGSVISGVPLVLILFKGMPYPEVGNSSHSFYCHATVLIILGLSHSWAAAACNNPIFAEIVPADMRNMVYAFDRSFEGAVSSMAAPLVALAARNWFQFPDHMNCSADHSDADRAQDFERAQSLGNALLLCTAVPWTLCALIYTSLYWSYPRDRRRTLQGLGP